MLFEWHAGKNDENIRKHGVSSEVAAMVFDDPYALSHSDASFSDEERFITVGAVGPGSVLFVVHTWRTRGREELIRIISARAASARERKAYEETNKSTKERNRRNRRQTRRGH